MKIKDLYYRIKSSKRCDSIINSKKLVSGISLLKMKYRTGFCCFLGAFISGRKNDDYNNFTDFVIWNVVYEVTPKIGDFYGII